MSDRLSRPPYEAPQLAGKTVAQLRVEMQAELARIQAAMPRLQIVDTSDPWWGIPSNADSDAAAPLMALDKRLPDDCTVLLPPWPLLLKAEWIVAARKGRRYVAPNSPFPDATGGATVFLSGKSQSGGTMLSVESCDHPEFVGLAFQTDLGTRENHAVVVDMNGLVGPNGISVSTNPRFRDCLFRSKNPNPDLVLAVLSDTTNQNNEYGEFDHCMFTGGAVAAGVGASLAKTSQSANAKMWSFDRCYFDYLTTGYYQGNGSCDFNRTSFTANGTDIDIRGASDPCDFTRSDMEASQRHVYLESGMPMRFVSPRVGMSQTPVGGSCFRFAHCDQVSLIDVVCDQVPPEGTTFFDATGAHVKLDIDGIRFPAPTTMKQLGKDTVDNYYLRVRRHHNLIDAEAEDVTYYGSLCQNQTAVAIVRLPSAEPSAVALHLDVPPAIRGG